MVATFLPAHAGTTGSLHGRVVDRVSQRGIPSAKVAVASPSQAENATTDANGNFVFISLIPDTYALSITSTGYETTTLTGITVLADQEAQYTLPLEKLTVIGRITNSASNIVKAGTTSDVYSINAAGAAAAATLGGPGGLNQAYSAMASVPGVSLQQGQQGWNQLAYVRGGDYEDTAVELDGVPMMRASDGAPISTLSNLGQGELQIYTGGAPASADASGISGYVNQVIRTGSYPGFKEITLGNGGPAGYHKGQIEIGGATTNRNFTYYVGFSQVLQDFRYGDQFNAASNPLYFYPLSIPTGLNGTVYDGSGTASFSPGQSYSISSTTDQELVANFHFAIPHKRGDGKDDIQLLYTNGRVFAPFYSSTNDLGGESYVSNAIGTPYFNDNYQYTGALMAPLNQANLLQALFPNSTTHPWGTTPIPANQQDTGDNGFSLLKLQYQRNFNEHSYLRLFAYTDYTYWFINGPTSAWTTYGGEIADYEVNGHTYGFNARYENQLSAKHLLTATASYQTQKTKTVSNGSNGGTVTEDLVDSHGNCYSPLGNYTSCFGSAYSITSTGTLVPSATGSAWLVTQYGSTPQIPGLPTGMAAANGAQWVVTENGQKAQVDNVHPFFSAASLSDQWQVNDNLVVNAGLRYEKFVYALNNSEAPARSFWFQAWNRENCYSPGQPLPATFAIDPNTGVPIDPATGLDFTSPPTGCVPMVNSSPQSVSYGALQPRTGLTYKLDPNTVLRASYGRYAQQPGASYQQYNYLQQNSASALAVFLPYGFNSPYHETAPSYSNSYDFSLEKRLKGTDLAFKVTPFYRVTQNELQSIPIGAQGVVDGLNTGTGRSKGIEFEFTKGDFSRDGLAFQLGYTYTNSGATFGNFLTGNNFIDDLNAYVKNYNALTSFCANNPRDARCAGGTIASGLAAAPCYLPGPPGGQPGVSGGVDPAAASTNACPSTDIVNPYWNSPVQPLFDRTGTYTPYDILPSNPFNGEVGFVTPSVVSAVVNYRIKHLTLTPTASYTSGTFYGAPLSWPGYDPTSCSAPVNAANQAQYCSAAINIPDAYTGVFDKQGAFREPTRFTLNFQAGYELSKNTKLTLSLTSLIDHCYQRGYPWDNPTTCVYAQLPSNLLAPAGNFTTPLSAAPVQLQYPYGSFYNNVQTGFSGAKMPFGAFLNLQMRL
ncbi:MAG: TonB-dependent receptor [Candidatus Velthaea sp.]